MKSRSTRASLRAEGRMAERADTLAAIATMRAALPGMIAAGKLDAEGGSLLDRRLATLAEQIDQRLHEGSAR